jgi:hypothetical protein
MIPGLWRLFGRDDDHRTVFERIHRGQAWGSDESASGIGSTRERAAAFIPELIQVLRECDTRLLMDAPCGDCNWIAPVADSVERYVGVDVVPTLIDANNARHAAPNRTFLLADLTRDLLPEADVILCRDCLVHFSFADARRAIVRLRESGSRYLLTTTFIGDRTNLDIRTGGWRPLNLQRAPFHFPAPLRLIDEHCTHSGGGGRDKRLALWRLEDLPG